MGKNSLPVIDILFYLFLLRICGLNNGYYWNVFDFLSV